MATKFSLTFWLKSLELEQYIETFQNHQITTQQQCLNLDEETLSDIGVSAVGHRRRILNHLPKDYFDDSSSKQDRFVAFQNPLSFQPALPKKEKNPRDSFLFREEEPVYQNDSTIQQPTYGNDAAVIDTLKKKEPQCVNSDKLKNTPKPAPRPVPRPRRTKMKNEDSDGNIKPEPVKRPTPAPRSSNTPSPTSTARPGSSNKNEASMKFEIEGVCESETSTDIDDFLNLYSKPIKNMEKLPSPCLNEDIQGKTPEFDTVYISGDETSLTSFDTKMDSNINTVGNDTKFENAEFDPLSGGYALKFPNVTGSETTNKDLLSQTFSAPRSVTAVRQEPVGN